MELADLIAKTAGKVVERSFGPARAGDIKESVADISRARRELGYEPKVGVAEGLERLIAHVRGGA